MVLHTLFLESIHNRFCQEIAGTCTRQSVALNKLCPGNHVHYNLIGNNRASRAERLLRPVDLMFSFGFKMNTCMLNYMRFYTCGLSILAAFDFVLVIFRYSRFLERV